MLDAIFMFGGFIALVGVFFGIARLMRDAQDDPNVYRRGSGGEDRADYG